tara:strand:+ start:226 stop:1098 length:873 start_codon:yes stop_codon:yes gene_type:complete
MAFHMNKPVIQGTKKHSALLAKAEQTRTHGGDPTLVDAASVYGKSNSPNVVDYKITQAKIEWDKKKKKKNKTKVEKDTSTKEVITPTEVPTEEVLTEVPTITELEKLTVNERKIEIAKADAEAAKKRLEAAARKRYDSKEVTRIDPISAQPIETPELKDEIILPKKIEREGSVADWDNAKFDKDGKLISGKGIRVQNVGGVSTQNLKTSYTEEEQSRLIFSEEHGRMVLPEEIGIKSDVIIENKKLDKKINKATIQSEKKVEKKSGKPRRWQFKTISSYNAAIESWKTKQ